MNYLSVAPHRFEFGLCRRSLQPRTPISDEVRNAKVVIGIAIHNQRDFIRASLISAIEQKIDSESFAIVVLNDSSSDQWEHEVFDLLQDARVLVVDGICGSPSHSRNAILDFVDQHLSQAQWVARLDADDILDSPESVSALVCQAESKGASFAIGSNLLMRSGEIQAQANIADPDVLMERRALLKFVESFCTGKGKSELPSCNLVLKTHSGFRYPLVKSAEDHWLVAELLMFHPNQGVIVPSPIYARYSLSGIETGTNRAHGKWQNARDRLWETVQDWYACLNSSNTILGMGQEGIVFEYNSYVFKCFYRSSMAISELAQIQKLVQRCVSRFPNFDYFLASDGSAVCYYPAQIFAELDKQIKLVDVREFLLDLMASKVIVTNIKRDNLRLGTQGELIYIDIGKDIVPMTPAGFLECAAKLYAVAYLKLDDHELAWRQSWNQQEDQLKSLPGFEAFYADILKTNYQHCLVKPYAPKQLPFHENVSLLIKACAQDAVELIVQVKHIVGNLACDRQFNKVVLLLDSFQGPFLRQFHTGNFSVLLENARILLEQKWIDELLIAPQQSVVIQQTCKEWFGIEGILHTHTHRGAPVFSQVWAFDRIDTPFVLQCDVDIFVGRKDIDHDYLQDMLTAIERPNVWCVGFNIAKKEVGFNEYYASEFGFVPEVRFGLLDLQKIKTARPLPNESIENQLTLMWHRSLEQRQQKGFYRSVRGGDSRTFYIHPLNADKPNLDMSRIRDLVGQGIYPTRQAEKWDLIADEVWSYPSRKEQIIFLMKGRNTSIEKIQRALNSLLIQTDQNFGLIYIDDASDAQLPYDLYSMLTPFMGRATLVRREERVGYIPNFLFAINNVCANDDSLIVVLDQDDALMSEKVVDLLRNARNQGVDLINGLLYRPNKPLKIYRPDYVSPRSKGGSNVWAHLRAFTKALFNRVPHSEFKFEDDWFEELTDFVTMLPMAELAERPMYIDSDFCYWHERNKYSIQRKEKQEKMKMHLFGRNSLN